MDRSNPSHHYNCKCDSVDDLGLSGSGAATAAENIDLSVASFLSVRTRSVSSAPPKERLAQVKQATRSHTSLLELLLLNESTQLSRKLIVGFPIRDLLVSSLFCLRYRLHSFLRIHRQTLDLRHDRAETTMA